MTRTRQRIDYLKWLLPRAFGADSTCPGCGNAGGVVVDRKYLTTSLFECPTCKLRFRVPKDEPGEAADYYQEAYHEGMTTQVPSDSALEILTNTNFASSEKDFSSYIAVLGAAGLKPGSTIFDFGCSWGYGSWQFRKAGFKVYSSEISQPRAACARVKLHCEMVDNVEPLFGTIDCFFSSHVIEHLPDPNILWNLARRLVKANGLIVTFCPNGSPKSSWASHYSDLWGRRHPLVITPEFVAQSAVRYGFDYRLYSDPYDLSAISRGERADSLPGEEICIVMHNSGGTI